MLKDKEFMMFVEEGTGSINATDAVADASPTLPETTQLDEVEKKAKTKKEMLSLLSDKLFEVLIFMSVLMTIYWLVIKMIGFNAEISGPSMNPVLADGDHVIVKRNIAGLSHGDIVIVESNKVSETPDENMIVKRVIGMEGDHLEMRDDVLYLNGKEMVESYIAEDMKDGLDFEFVVPEGTVWVMGDNRNVSVDSRHNGAFSIEDEVMGIVAFRGYFFDKVNANE